MTRSPLTLVLAALLAVPALAACGAAEPAASAPTAATPAPPVPSSAPTTTPPVFAPLPGAAAGVPELSGNPTDLSAPTQAGAGTGTPPAELVVQDVVVGNGPPALPTDTVQVQYSGTLYGDGTLFDSSWENGEPAVFSLDRVVPGFAQGIAGMQTGGRRVIVIPPALGYGDQARGPIPGGSTLVFVVDLVSLA